jgi:thiamine biosynthesis lipoprotein
MHNYTHKLNLFGGTIEIVLYHLDEVAAAPIVEDIYREAKRLEKIFNFFDPQSELSRLNKKREIKASDEFIKVIGAALSYCRLTNGAYDISLGKNFLERKNGLSLSKLHCSYEDIVLDKTSIRLGHEDVMIDLGSAAKGFIGDMIATRLKDLGIISAFLDFRGDMIMFGTHSENIAVQHPRVKDKTIFTFTADNTAVATSGDYMQYKGSFENSHILGKKDIISATVIAPTLLEADLLATSITVCGIKQLGIFHNQRYFVIDNKLKKHISPSFKDENP